MARTRSPLPDGRAKARRAAMAEAPDRGPLRNGYGRIGSKRPVGGGGAECSVRRAVRCDGRTDGVARWRPGPTGRVGAALGVPTGDQRRHGAWDGRNMAQLSFDTLCTFFLYIYTHDSLF